MINLANIVNDTDFAQPFTIERSSGGAFKAGKWIDATTNVASFGIVQPSSPEELEQVPEADRVKGAMSFHSSGEMYETHVDAQTGISDLIYWRGQWYRIVKVFPWIDFGYYKAIGVRKSGE